MCREPGFVPELDGRGEPGSTNNLEDKACPALSLQRGRLAAVGERGEGGDRLHHPSFCFPSDATEQAGVPVAAHPRARVPRGRTGTLCLTLPYLVDVRRLLDGVHGVRAVLQGLPTHYADGLLVLLAEQLQPLVVLGAQGGPRLQLGPQAAPQPQLADALHDVGQLPVGSEAAAVAGGPALRAGEGPVGPQPFVLAVLGNAASAEVVAAVDADRLAHVLQANGANGLLLQPLQSTCQRHGGPLVSTGASLGPRQPAKAGSQAGMAGTAPRRGRTGSAMKAWRTSWPRYRVVPASEPPCC